jgi:hypothetical protein
MAIKALFATTLVGGLLLNSSAWSCVVFQPFRFEAIKAASIVFRGRVINYGPRVGNAPATIEFKIVEVYRGDHSDQLKLSWPNETFETPRTWTGSPEVIVAAVPNPYHAHLNDPRFNARLSALAKEPFAVFQEACSSPFLLEDTSENRSKVRALLKQ